ncbi:LysR family transcriptional regulator [Litchfieldella qijiaojingensis]|uniref:LysR family transcriptional regulator n=1 Tax=Litchfieldella qijiaojingensis TaxID=980347 RepID=A0ABQ2YR28_9GAMM|nr:LysR substrate-binding domain-containing protein [Halomonas qijiaojingensis]GGX89678.1 LysR family transcriptional regulator [Halomonas qijiaojingensis]
MSQPPLKAIQCFCLAAQHLSFKKAADEAAVTPGAISQQIKSLENWLGMTLFERRARSIVLTEAGNAYYRRIAPLMEELIGVSQSMQQLDRLKVVRLSLPPAFALLFLGPALPAFRSRHPNIELRLNASSLLYSLQEAGNDLAIRYLPRADDQLDCTLLTQLHIFPVCSPAYLAAHPDLVHGHLHGVTLINDILHQDWPRLIQAHDLKLSDTHRLHVDQALLAHQSAENGLGIALGDSLLSRQALESGRLVVPFDASLPARRHIYLAHARKPLLSPAACTVKRWIIETFRDPSLALP